MAGSIRKIEIPFQVDERVVIKRHEGGYEEGRIVACYITPPLFSGKNSFSCDVMWGDKSIENVEWIKLLHMDDPWGEGDCNCRPRRGGKSRKYSKSRKSRKSRKHRKHRKHSK